MQLARRETGNLFATFSMQSEFLRRGGAFLTGMALAVLLALSTPSAQATVDRLAIAAIDDVVAGDEGWIIAIDDVAADAGGWITAIDEAVGARGGIAAYAAGAGSGFAAFGDITREIGGGIAAFGRVEEEIATLAVEVENSIGHVAGFKFDNNTDDSKSIDDGISVVIIEPEKETVYEESNTVIGIGRLFDKDGEELFLEDFPDGKIPPINKPDEDPVTDIVAINPNGEPPSSENTPTIIDDISDKFKGNDPMADHVVTEPEDEVIPIGDTITVGDGITFTTAVTTDQRQRCYRVYYHNRVCRNPVTTIDTTTTSGSFSGSGDGVGVFASRVSDVEVDFTRRIEDAYFRMVLVNEADIDNVHHGIRSTRDGIGALGVENRGRITDAEHGIRVSHTGTGNLWVLSKNPESGTISEIVSSSEGIFAQHEGRGVVSVGVRPGAKVVSEESDGVAINHNGIGYVRASAYIQGEIRGDQAGISVSHNSQQDVPVWDPGSDEEQDISIWIAREAEVHGGVSGIKAHMNRAVPYGDWGVIRDDGGREIKSSRYLDKNFPYNGNIIIDVAGKVSSALSDDGVAIDMAGGYYNKLVLRPEFELDGVAVSSGGSVGILVLASTQWRDRVHGLKQPGVLDLSAQKFLGFDHFEMNGSDEWTVQGVADDEGAFKRAKISGTLTFSNVNFKMAEWQRVEMEWPSPGFVVDKYGNSWEVPGYEREGYGNLQICWCGVLKIAGNNHLRGDLWHKSGGRSNIIFASEGKPDSLTVAGRYLGGGDLVFHVGSNQWDDDKLVIDGDILLSSSSSDILVNSSGRVSDSFPDISPVLIKVKGMARAHHFIGDEIIGAFRYVLEHDTVGHVAPDINRMQRDLYDYYDDFYGDYWEPSVYGNFKVLDNLPPANGDLDAIDRIRRIRSDLYDYYSSLGDDQSDYMSQGLQALDKILAGEDLDGFHTWRFRRQGLSPSAKTAKDVPSEMLERSTVAVDRESNAEGGVWAHQHSLRDSRESTLIVGDRSRTQDERVHLGFDLPSTNLMGGDLVIGASMWQGLSTSDASSRSNLISVESYAATMTASWWSPSGFYAGGQTQYVSFSSDISAEGLSLVQDNEGMGMSVSAEVGYRFAVPFGGMDFHVVPQMEVVWSRIGFNDFVGPHNELISLEDGDLVAGRLGLLWNGEWRGAGGSGYFYGGMDLHGALDGRTAVNVSGVSLASEQRGLSVDGRLGASYEWSEGYAFHGETVVSRRDDADEVRANLGVRIDF